MTELTLSLDDWTQQGQQLAADHRNLMWKIAAWLEKGVERFGDAAEQIACDLFLKKPAQLKEILDIAKRFPPEERRPELSFTHHKMVAKLPDDQAAQVLDDAIQTKASVQTVKKAVNRIRESEGGDVFAQMAAVSQEELLDDWYGKMTRLWNRCPNGADGRKMFFEAANEADGGIID